MSGKTRDILTYTLGFALAAALTAIAFGALLADLPRATAVLVIGIAAVAQVVVQFRLFMHIDVSRQKREDLHLILFTCLIIAIMVGGSVWILQNQATRMM